MFKLSTCQEFVDLREQYPDFVSSNDAWASWGLKENGTLFVVDQIHKKMPKKILEVGAGESQYFANRFGTSLEYWMIDNGDMYPDPEKFRNSIFSLKKKINFIDGLLGDFSPQLPQNYFDMVFSISALEHSPRDNDKIDCICSDMYRVLKPGGFVCHTIDITPGDPIAEMFLSSLNKAGFVFYDEPKELNWNVADFGSQILLETLRTAYQIYYRKWRETNRPIRFFHFGSVLVLAYK